MSAPTVTTPATAGGGVPVGGSGAAGYLAKWTATTTLGGSTATGATASPYVDATGNVGIGTASPSYKLTIENSDSTAYSTATQASPMASLRNTYGSAGNTQVILAYSTANYSSVWNTGLVETGGGAYTGAHIWQNRTGASAWAERMRIDSSGRLLVGTSTAPAAAGARATLAHNANLYLSLNNTTTNTGVLIGVEGTKGIFYTSSGALGSESYVISSTYDANGVQLGTSTGMVFNASGSQQGLKLQSTPGNTDPNTLDCYAETDVSSGYTLIGVTVTSGAITVAIRATRIGRTMTLAISITPATIGASLTFAAGWYITMTGVSAPAFAGSLAVSSNDATITRGTAWVNAVSPPTAYGSAAILGADKSLFLNGTI